MKPADWPRYMKAKRLRSGDAVAYYWAPHERDLALGCPVGPEPLGRAYGPACARAAFLNTHLDAWRSGRTAVIVPEARPGFGTLGWLFDHYLKTPGFLRRVSERSRYEYRRALERIVTLPLRGGTGTAADLPVAAVTPAAVDVIYERLRTGPRGPRLRQANLSIDIARRAWTVMHRKAPETVPAANPFKGVERDLRKATKPAATREEAYALAAELAAMGEPHLGAAALICFEWHQRPEHVLKGDITWADYRPRERPAHVQIRHAKTGVKGWLPLEDDDGTPFYPELEAYLAAIKREGVPIVLTAGRRGPARPPSSEYAERKVREARRRAGLPEHVTLDTCRHGGMTEHGDSGASEAETMSASMHKTPQATRLYVKRTEAQRLSAARKRRALILSRVGTRRQTKSGNGGRE